MNTRNMVMLTGYFPNQEKMGKAVMYKEGEGSKKSFYRGKISVRRAFKSQDEDKYTYDYIPFKAFGASADYIHKYVDQEGGDQIQIMGELHIGENYEDKDGNTVYGTPEVIVDQVSIVSSGNGNGGSRSSNDDGDSKRSAAPKASAPTAKRSNPLARLRGLKS